MNAYLNDQPLSIERDSIALAITAARKASELEGKLIIDVLADGAQIADELLATPPDDAAGISELRFSSVRADALISTTLRDAADALIEAGERQREAAGQIQRGDTDDANATLSQALATWAVVRDVVDKTAQLMGSDPGEIAFTDSNGTACTGMDCISNLATQLEEIRASIEVEDWSGLSDVLGYEMDAQVSQWRGFLDALAQKAEAGA